MPGSEFLLVFMIKRIISIVLALALLAWLIADRRWQSVGTALFALPGHIWGLALAGMGLSYLLRAIRVYEEFRQPGQKRFWLCVRIVLVHNAWVNVLPFRSGEAAFPILLRRYFGTPLPQALISLFWFRLQDAFVVAGAACLLLPGLPTFVRGAGLLGLGLCAWALPSWARKVKIGQEAQGGWRQKFEKVRAALAHSTKHARWGWVWTVGNWSIKLAVQATLLAGLLHSAWPLGATGALGAELAAILPIQGVAGFGTYEAGAAAALRAGGVLFEAGLQAALGLHLFMIASAVSAGALASLFVPGQVEMLENLQD